MTHLSERAGEEVLVGIREVRPEPGSVEAVSIKPLVWDTDPLGNMLAIAACGWATVEVRSDGRWRWSLGGVAAGTERRKEDAIKMLTVSYEARIRSALENPPVALADATKESPSLSEAREEIGRLRGEPVGWAAVYDGDPKMFRRSRDELVAEAATYQAIHPVYFGPAWRHQED